MSDGDVTAEDVGGCIGCCGCTLFLLAITIGALWSCWDSIQWTTVIGLTLAVAATFSVVLLFGGAVAAFVDYCDTAGDRPRRAKSPPKLNKLPKPSPAPTAVITTPQVNWPDARDLEKFRATAVKRYDERVQRFDERTTIKE